MNSMVRNMVRDYTASSEVDPQAALAFQENITVTLSQSDLKGAVIVNEEPDKDGQWWCVMHLSKANVAREIGQAQAAARLAVPAMASFDAEARMNEAFEQAAREGW
jgi:succinylglutamate desuccinylase